MRAFDEEVFGPVAAIAHFATEDEAVDLANHNEYGLSAGVFSKSVGRALAVGNRLRTGLLHINDQTVADEPHIPFGGTGASGNGTRIGGPANWEEFTQLAVGDDQGQARILIRSERKGRAGRDISKREELMNRTWGDWTLPAAAGIVGTLAAGPRSRRIPPRASGSVTPSRSAA